MRMLWVLAVLWVPSVGMAEQRFGEWVSLQLGYVPHYTQSIGWDMAATTVRFADPVLPDTTETQFIATPDTTAWIVGMSANLEDAYLAGMALVWSDGPFVRVEDIKSPSSQSGIVAFQTPAGPPMNTVFAELAMTQLKRDAPGPVLAQLPDGTQFAIGDSGKPDVCFQYNALYTRSNDLGALVVLFQSHQRGDADTGLCVPLTS